MRIVFVSGFLSEHLSPLCNELNNRSEFTFIATQNRENLTTLKEQIKTDYTLNYFEPQNREKSQKLIRECDVAIFGGSSEELLDIRKKTGKIAFIYTERLLRKGKWRRFIPSVHKRLHRQFLTDNQNVYVLCAGAYVKSDLKVLGFDTKKCYKFGYFPRIALSGFNEGKTYGELSFICVGRFLKLKRFSDVIKCCAKLGENGYPYKLKIVGKGPEKDNLQKLVRKYNADESVEFIEFAPHDKVMELMKESSVLFFSSNKKEGWGAVVNEAMSNQCVVIGSRACGSIPYLIKENVNGYSYKAGDVSELFKKLKTYVETENKTSLHKAAYDTVANEWNERVAADRLIKISKELSENNPVTAYDDGPMSKA